MDPSKECGGGVRWLWLGNLLLPVALWCDLFRVLHLEWRFNDQYAYGWIVPVAGAYLLWVRWLDRPPGASQGPGGAGIGICLLVLVGALGPLRIVLEANPEWRRLYWIQGGIVLGATMATLARWGGVRWCGHFAWALVFLLVAIPWPVPIERVLVWHSMESVARLTAWVADLFHVYARVEGNVIQLARGAVGVEEACSGIRSLQVSVMGALFLGDLCALGARARVALLALGLCVAYAFNVLRALLLTACMHGGGSAAVAAWHGPLGQALPFAALMVLGALAALLAARRRGRARPDRSNAAGDPVPRLRLFPWPIVMCALGLFAGGFACVHAWYAARQPARAAGCIAAPDWTRLGVPMRRTGLSQEARAQLRYTRGERVEWSQDGIDWIALYLEWDRGRSSAFMGVHRPETCLPSVGFREIGVPEPVTWVHGNMRLALSAHRFASGNRVHHVFFAVWDEGGVGALPAVRSAADRVASAWRGLRMERRRSLEIVLQGGLTTGHAWEHARAMLTRVLANGDA